MKSVHVEQHFFYQPKATFLTNSALKKFLSLKKKKKVYFISRGWFFEVVQKVSLERNSLCIFVFRFALSAKIARPNSYLDKNNFYDSRTEYQFFLRVKDYDGVPSTRTAHGWSRFLLKMRRRPGTYCISTRNLANSLKRADPTLLRQNCPPFLTCEKRTSLSLF